ncbi:MAG TPA: histidine kinase [Bacteroidales bacterium]|nr:histidine kinase [Bacteroidales bacterium]
MKALPGKRRLSWTLSQYILAIPLTIAVIYLLPDSFRKYHTEIVRTGAIDKPGGYEYYADIDRDGASERVILFNNTEGKASIKTIDHNGFIIGHHYFRGEIIPNPGSLLISAYDTSGIPGIFLFTHSHDTLLLHGICPGGEKYVLFHDYPIAVIPEVNGHHDFSISSFDLVDLDGDGTREIIAGIMAGFRVQPRLIFTLEIRTLTLKRTATMATFQGVNDTIDLNGDGSPELLARSYAIDNNEGKQELPFDDNSAWLLSYDRNMEPVLPLTRFSGRYVHVIPLGIRDKKTPMVVALLTTRVPGTGPPRLMLFDNSGKAVRERVLGDDSRLRVFNILRTDAQRDRFFLLSGGGTVEVVDSKLKTIETRKIDGLDSPSCFAFDIDGDGLRELIFPGSAAGPLVITRADLTEPVRIYHPFDLGGSNYQVIKDAGKAGELFVQSGDRYVVYAYNTNTLTWLRYPIWMVIYLLIAGFMALASHLAQISLRKRVEAERKIAEMQLLLLGNQLDPHFTFNAINSISASILHQDSSVANRNLLSLSRLMRANVMQSDRIDRSLAEELDFLQNYISLIHSRMESCFRYRIDLEEGVNLSIRVPKMMTQIFVENAIKHGLKPNLAPGVLTVRIRNMEHGVVIEVEDNGVGRNNTTDEESKGTGKGMAIVTQTIGVLNRYNTQQIRLEVTDGRNDQGAPCGTIVRLSVPDRIRYRFYTES